ncbi:MAG: hypothetical protein MRY83_17685 [Flavobacteriales bacterium]|nr:hypothetical protein [Flavobacteriales bacterium]
MKKLFSISSLLLLTIGLFSQSMIREADWSVGSAKALTDGKQIIRTNGENGESGITNVTYQSPEVMIEKAKADAKTGNWNKSKLNSKLEEYKSRAKGGMLQLYIERSSMAGSNSQNFTVEVKKGDKLIQSKTMRNKAGKEAKGSYKNEGLMWLKEEIETPFEVYVKEKDSETVTSFQIK